MNKTEKNNKSVRVRFAPSPTGYLHIGGLRTALFNWLFARNKGGTFLVRIEDTDMQRSENKYTEEILEALAWTEIRSDEPVMYQSQRFEIHKELIDSLIEQGKAYYCYCSEEEINTRCAVILPDGATYIKYDRHCLIQKNKANGQGVVRFKLPDGLQKVAFHDLIRGRVSFPASQLDDFIIARSDERPVYNFVVVVDDDAMDITHVIRGEDHLSNTPKQILLYQALGYDTPEFSHLPLILNPEGGRLSKRDAATAVLDYKDQGYLSDALVNYLVRLGWSHGDQEIFTRDELITYFSLDHVGKKGAVFDMEKLGWVNGVYIKNMLSKDLLKAILDVRDMFRLELKDWSDEQVLALIDLYKPRAITLLNIADDIKALYDGSTPYSIDDVNKWITMNTRSHLEAIVKELVLMGDEPVRDRIKKVSDQFSCKLVDIAQPIRIALTGKSSGPGVFDLLSILSKDESVKRLHRLIEYIDEKATHE